MTILDSLKAKLEASIDWAIRESGDGLDYTDILNTLDQVRNELLGEWITDSSENADILKELSERLTSLIDQMDRVHDAVDALGGFEDDFDDEEEEDAY